MSKIVTIGNSDYEVIQNYKDGFSLPTLLERWTDYFEEYDYIVGDYAYDKLRLKGFCSSQNKRWNTINDKDLIQYYILNDCAYECRYFVLQKVSVDLH